MFKHETAPNCNFKEKCSKNLCQFQHTEEEFKKGDNCKFFKTSSEKLENNSCSSDTHKYEKVIIKTMMTNISNAIIVLTFQKVVF